MQPIQAKYIEYNANTRDADVGDCTKRALSLAFGLDYDDTSKEMNRIKRELHLSDYNHDKVIDKFIDKRGVKLVGGQGDILLDDFAESHPTGTYLVETGKPNSPYPNHIVCVIDGNIYDSWNSGNQKVFKVGVVNAAPSSGWDYQAVNIDNIFPELCNYTVEYCSQLRTKYSDYLEYLDLRSHRIQDSTTGVIRVGVQVLGEDDYQFSSYRSGFTYVHEIVVKLNIKLSEEENIVNLKKKLKQKLYDWVYNVVDDLKAARAARGIEYNTSNKHFSRMSAYDKRFVTKLPEWAWPLVESVSTDDTRWSGYKFRVVMYRLDDDPRASRYSDIVFYADTLKELKYYMQRYHDNFEEPNY